jgi:peroxiredoxin Q/BCP
MKINSIMIALFVFTIPVSLLGQAESVLKVGDKAPVFMTVDDSNHEWRLDTFLGEKNIVIFFYPAAMTGGCTKQACAYRDDHQKLADVDAIVVGISGDEVHNLALFKQAHNLDFPLLSDKDGIIAKKYGVPLRDGGSITREIEGKEYELQRGVTAYRWTFIIDKKGEIAYKNEKVDAANDSKNVLEVIHNLDE